MGGIGEEGGVWGLGEEGGLRTKGVGQEEGLGE